MKNILSLFLLLFVLISCKSNSKQPVKDSAVNVKIADPTHVLIEQFGPIIQGVWVKSDYINDLVLTKSPYASRKKLDGTAAFTIEMDLVEKDSVVVGASLNNHEGSSFALVFRKGHRATSLVTRMKDYDLKTNYFELGYNIAGRDTSLILYHYNRGNHIIDSTKYTKVLSKQFGVDMDNGVEYITNKLLITGNYTTTDTTGTALNIKFMNDGKVLGFPDFVKYFINTDFVAGPENDLDQLYFDDYEKNQKQFLFKIKADTLNIYDVNESADSIHLEWGKLKYKLVKVK
jgi:hypothetical protein